MAWPPGNELTPARPSRPKPSRPTRHFVASSESATTHVVCYLRRGSASLGRWPEIKWQSDLALTDGRSRSEDHCDFPSWHRRGASSLGDARRHQPRGDGADSQLVRRRHRIPADRGRVPCGPRIAEPAHLALHRGLRVSAHSRWHAVDQDRDETDHRPRTGRSRGGRGDVRAVGELPRAGSLPGHQRYWWLRLRRRGHGGHGHLVPGPRGHPGARRHWRGGLQRRGCRRPLCLGLHPAGRGLAHVTGSGRDLRARGHGGDSDRIRHAPGPTALLRGEIRSLRTRSLASQQGPVGLRDRAPWRLRRLLHYLTALHHLRHPRSALERFVRRPAVRSRSCWPASRAVCSVAGGPIGARTSGCSWSDLWSSWPCSWP